MKFEESGLLDGKDPKDAESKPLKNSDFRKLLTTARSGDSVYSKNEDLRSNLIRNEHKSEARSKPFAPDTEKKQKKKHKYSHRDSTRQKKNPNDSVKETQQKYRDRAKERRDGKIMSVAEGVEKVEDEDDLERDEYLRRTADYRAVAPNAASTVSAMERRKTIIEESKYLGGDMEHTHLVKGLDYVLLQKTRQKIREDVKPDEELDLELSKIDSSHRIPKNTTELEIKDPMVSKMFKVLFEEKPVERNEYFMPGRMAFRVELDDELAESDVPATLIRSKLDLPSIGFFSTHMDGTSTNEIVMNKLTQILSYLRSGKRQAKKIKKNQDVETKITDGLMSRFHLKDAGISIYEDIPSQYVPTPKIRDDDTRIDKDSRRDRDTDSHHRSRDRREDEKDKRSSKYFSRREEPDEFEKPPKTSHSRKSNTGSSKPQISESHSNSNSDKLNLDKLLKKSQPSGYDECYPGFAESYDAMGDSDEEADLLKMDMGSRRGPMGRWDFDTHEEYSDYMSNKEALPKAAFQFGVKMNAGRKTRRVGVKDEKAELDREWNKIQNIIHKRSGDSSDAPPMKIARN